MDGVPQHRPLVTPELCGTVGGKELWQQPARAVDGRHQADQGGRVGHRGDKERQDGAKGGKADGEPEETAIHHIEDDVIAQVFSCELFNLGKGKHGVDSTACPPFLPGIADRIQDTRKTNHAAPCNRQSFLPVNNVESKGYFCNY